MKRAMCLRILPRSPGARCRRDGRAAKPVDLGKLAAWANCLSPVVQPALPDSLLLDVTGCERLFGGEDHLLRTALCGLASEGFAACGTIADTVGAAWAVAHGNRVSVVIPPGRVVAALAPLPPWTLRLSDRDAETLLAVGVRKIEALLQIPRASLASRFGDGLRRRLDQALGHVPEPLDPYRPPAEPVSRIRFAGVTDRLEVIHEAADRLLAFFCEQLERRAVGVRSLLCTMYHEDAAPTTREVGLSRPTRSVNHLRSLLHARLEASPPTAVVFGMMLWSRAVEALGDAQGRLFDPGDGSARWSWEDGEGLTCLLDRLSNRLGAEAVVRPELVADHQPERAYRCVPVMGGEEGRRSVPSEHLRAGSATELGFRVPGSGVRDAGTIGVAYGLSREGANSSFLGGGRPLRLFARPVEVRAMAIVPDGPPTWFRWEGREHVISDAIGPERIETGWWRGDDVQRDYFAVASSAGRRFWLFRERRGGRWFVQGSFE